ncbi:hypothetical protein D3C75_1021380 [compost metagenome]
MIVAVASEQEMFVHERVEPVSLLCIHLLAESFQELFGRHSCISNIGYVFYIALKYHFDGVLAETAHFVQPMLEEVFVQLPVVHIGQVVVHIDGDGERVGCRSTRQLHAEYQAKRKCEEAWSFHVDTPKCSRKGCERAALVDPEAAGKSCPTRQLAL